MPSIILTFAPCLSHDHFIYYSEEVEGVIITLFFEQSRSRDIHFFLYIYKQQHHLVSWNQLPLRAWNCQSLLYDYASFIYIFSQSRNDTPFGLIKISQHLLLVLSLLSRRCIREPYLWQSPIRNEDLLGVANSSVCLHRVTNLVLLGVILKMTKLIRAITQNTILNFWCVQGCLGFVFLKRRTSSYIFEGCLHEFLFFLPFFFLGKRNYTADQLEFCAVCINKNSNSPFNW